MSLPLFTIGVASFNNAHYIVDTLNSLSNQTYSGPIEIIVVDDCSRDNSVEIIENWLSQLSLHNQNHPNITARFIKHEVNKGVCAACNSVAKNASGKYITIIGSDDLKTLDSTAAIVDIFEKQDDTVAVVYSNSFIIDENGKQQPGDVVTNDKINVKSGWIFNDLLSGSIVPASSSVVRLSAIKDVGYYDESLSFEDWDMWLRIAKKYTFVYTPICTAYYRKHQTQWSQKFNPKTINSIFKILDKHAGINESINIFIEKRKNSLLEELYSKYGAKFVYKWFYKQLINNPNIKLMIFFIASFFRIPYPYLMSLKKNSRG